MGLRLNTDCIGARMRAEYWYETVLRSVANCQVLQTGPVTPHFKIVVRKAGDLPLFSSSSTPRDIRRIGRHIRGDSRDSLHVAYLRRGTALTEQDDRRIQRGPGTILISDLSRPYAEVKPTEHEVFGFLIDRERLERVFGSSRRFTMLPIDETVGSGPIIAFLCSLFDNAERLAPEVAAEMAAVGIELVMNGLARRLAMEPALPQSAALLLHRAQVFITANLADPALNPATIAAAQGISLRHLQALFHRRQTTPSDWMWRRRLARARERLASPSFAAVSVAEVAYGCGFADQGHFSRRFKAEFGLSPREWRQRSLIEVGNVTEPTSP